MCVHIILHIRMVLFGHFFSMETFYSVQMIPVADIEGSDQIARMRGLFCVLAVRIAPKTRLSMERPK